MKVLEVEAINNFYKIYKIIRIIIRNNFAAQLQYRLNLIIRILGALAELLVTLVFFRLIYNFTSYIGEWDYEQMIILVLAVDITRNLLLGCFVKNLPKIESMIIDGKLDLYITKPINSQFYISFQQISLGHIIQLIVSLCILMIVLYNSKTITVDICSVILYLFCLLCGSLIGYSLWIIIMSYSFYIIKVKALHEIFLDSLQLGKYPSSVYKKHIRRILLYVFPVLMISAYPTEIFLRFASISSVMVLIIVTICLFIISNFVWWFGIRLYESAGG